MGVREIQKMNQENKTCQNCKQEFNIPKEDFAFFEMMRVPAPTFCYLCRMQRRMTWRNERGLHRRQCDLCHKNIIAMSGAEAPFPVYCRPCWYSDSWDALSYGRDYDFSRDFFSQFNELKNVTPRLALQVDNCTNSDFANQIGNCKNCYLITSGSENEDCMYSYRVLNSYRVADCFYSLHGQHSYESKVVSNSSNILYSEDIGDSFNLAFCRDVRGSQNCFMSHNLRQSSYVFRNEHLGKVEYERRMAEIDLGSHAQVEEYKKEYAQMMRRMIHPYAHMKNAVNSAGENLINTKDCSHCFHGSSLENCSYCLLVNNAKDTRDVNNGCCTMERYYEVCTAGLSSSNAKFSIDAWPEVNNIEYCDTCRNGARDLFGCISVRGKQYCILNKQYSKDAFDELRLKIIKQMGDIPYTDAKGRVYKYGEFFPAEMAPFPYQDSMASDFFPLSAEEAGRQGFVVSSTEKPKYQVTMLAEDLPNNIKDVGDDILNQVIGCAHAGQCNESCTAAFKIIPQELEFYKQMKVPLPRFCSNCRHYQRFQDRKVLKLWHRKCMHDGCNNEFDTTFAPDSPFIIYCENCYNKEVV